MKRLEKFFNMKMIRNRIIAVQLGVIIPAVILLGVMIYGMTSAMLIKTNSESYLKVLESADIILSHYLDSYRDITRNVLADPVRWKTDRRAPVRGSGQCDGKVYHGIFRRQVNLSV